VILTDLQRDALAEMANISASGIASQLSLLLRDTITIRVPTARMVPLRWLREQIEPNSGGSDTGCVYQALSGSFDGRIYLLLHDEHSRSLLHALVGDVTTGTEYADLQAYEHEAMTEIGNIIISSFAAMMIELLNSELELSMPAYLEGSTRQLLFMSGAEPIDEDQPSVIVIDTELHATERQVSGSLLLILRLLPVTALLQRLDAMMAELS